MADASEAGGAGVVTVGRIGIDIYPLQSGVGLEDVETFGKYLGGSATNVAVAAARLGEAAAVFTGVGADPFGRYARRELRRLGVADHLVQEVPELHTPVTFCEIFPPDEFPLWFYRSPSAPDLQIVPGAPALDAARNTRLLWFTLTGLSEEPSRATHHRLLAARAEALAKTAAGPAGVAGAAGSADAVGPNGPTAATRAPGAAGGAGSADAVEAARRIGAAGVAGAGPSQPAGRIGAALSAGAAAPRHTVFDLDYRAQFWSSPAEAHREARAALPYATVAVGNREECEVAVGETEPDRAADALLDAGVQLAIVKQGPRGVLAKTAEERLEVPPFLVEVVNGLGAGDGFGGALVHGLLRGWPLARTIAFANAAGAIVASRLECSTAMPTEAEVEQLIQERQASASGQTPTSQPPTQTEEPNQRRAQ
ncbi:MAG: PfkB family carbohydrate kinase [Bifidobacteriaceae bacterium]|jgi:5-dehydro-2-deoxygluconokinase|nr:PfkB family carbohydrate kinase [Bifidobacteriaceae bacterium]